MQGDFIEASTAQLLSNPGPLFSEKEPGANFTHAILNPPYKKIRSNWIDRQRLHSVGKEALEVLHLPDRTPPEEEAPLAPTLTRLRDRPAVPLQPPAPPLKLTVSTYPLTI